jgi:hypothetical protein
MNQKVEIKEDDLQRLILKVEALTDAIRQLVDSQRVVSYPMLVAAPNQPTIYPLVTTCGPYSTISAGAPTESTLYLNDSKL